MVEETKELAQAPATVQVRIRGYQFSVSAPYKPGQKLGEAEALHLNDLRADNVRNNLKKLVDDACAGLEPGTMLEPEELAGLQAKISDYDSRYCLQLKHQARPRVGVIEAEARVIAELRLDEQLRAAEKQVSQEEYERLVVEFMALAEVQELARKHVQAKREVVQGALEDLL